MTQDRKVRKQKIYLKLMSKYKENKNDIKNNQII